MCRCRLTELNCVRTKIRFRPDWMQLAIGMSIRRYLPAIGTAGLLRDLVRGYRRVPRPPPRIRQITFGMTAPRPKEDRPGTHPPGRSMSPPRGRCPQPGYHAAG